MLFNEQRKNLYFWFLWIFLAMWFPHHDLSSSSVWPLNYWHQLLFRLQWNFPNLNQREYNVDRYQWTLFLCYFSVKNNYICLPELYEYVAHFRMGSPYFQNIRTTMCRKVSSMWKLWGFIHPSWRSAPAQHESQSPPAPSAGCSSAPAGHHQVHNTVHVFFRESPGQYYIAIYAV